MKALLRYCKICGIFTIIILFISFSLGTLNLIGLSYKVSSIINIVLMILLFLVMGIFEGFNALKKGYIAGLKVGIILLSILILLNFILFQSSFEISRVIYYFILIFSSVFGAMIGINRKKKE